MKTAIVFLCLLVSGVSAGAQAQTTQEGRQFLLLAATTTSTTVSTMVTPQFGANPVPAKKISIRNDGASGTADIYIALNRQTVGTPADNTVNIGITIKPGEEYRDGQVSISVVAFKSSSGTQALRITWGL